MAENLYDESWRAGGTCRVVCRPVRTKKRCFNAAKVKSVAEYAIKCGESRENIDDALNCVSCGRLLDVLAEVQDIKTSAEQEIKTLESILSGFAVVAALLRLIPTWIRRFPIIRRFFFALEALLAFADVLSDAIGNLLDALIKIEALLLALASEVCNDEDGKPATASTAGTAQATG